MAGLKNSAKMPINLNAFSGGESVDYKNGVQNSFYDSVALDFRKKSSQMSVLPGMTATTSGLSDLIVAMTQDPTGVRWAVGDTGKVYKIALDGTISTVATLSSASGHGIVYNQLSDMLYITGQQTVSMYGPITSSIASPVFYSDQFGKSASVANGVVNLYNPTDGTYDGTARNNAQSIGSTVGITSASQVTSTTATSSYTLKNVISEASADLCVFAPDLEPFYSIAVYVNAKGTGNWTLTLHDGLNNVVASKTIANAGITANAWNEFVFTAPGVRSFTGAVQSGLSAAYHFHLTSSVASDTATIFTTTASDMTGTNFLLFVARMVQTNNTWHPATIFTGSQMMLCVGNGQYLSTYTFANDQKPSNNVWQRERFPLDAGYEVCGLTVNNQYLVIAAEKRSTSNVNNFQDGMLYFWDGINATYNFKIEVPMGAPYSIYTYNNITYFICAGSLFAWGGGQQVIKVRPIAYQNTDYLGMADNTVVNPNMMDSRYNLLMIGYPSATTNTQTRYGIYTWGSVELIYPNSFGLSYLLSNGQLNASSTNNLHIGMVKNFVDTMYTSWKYTDTGGTTHYGLDITNNFSQPAPNFSWQSLIWDGGARYKLKQALRLKINFLPLPTGSTITAKVSADRQNWTTYSNFTANAGATELVIDLSDTHFHELQWGFDGTCSGATTTPPTITGIVMEIDALGDEVDITGDDIIYG
jgi:hypothetical protein